MDIGGLDDGADSLGSRLSECVGVGVVDLAGRGDVLDVLFEAIPAWTRVLLAGYETAPVTIDVYNNVHKKGVTIHPFIFDPRTLFVRAGEDIVREQVRRAARILGNPGMAEACRSALDG
jgi:hypothetical protein